MGRRVRPIWTADCETDPFKRGRIPKPFVWGLWTGSSFHVFDRAEDFVRYVLDQDAIVYFHNGGRFDFHFLLDFIPEGESISIINGRLVKFRIGDCEFRDSFCLINAPLAAYKKTEVDYRIFEEDERTKRANRDKIVEYLRDDCVFLHELVSGFVKEYGLHLTQASAAMKYWERMTKQEAPRSDAAYYDRLAGYYYGGRVQCFETGVIDVPFEAFDINSAYPFAMLSQHPLSTAFEVRSKLPDDERLGPMMITVECEARGCFPWRNPDDGKLYFPTEGVRVYRVTGWEYLAALELGLLGKRRRIVETLRFVFGTDFGQYVRHFYALRKDAKAVGDDARSLWCKVMMNALYGKFAANPRNYGEFVTMGREERRAGYEFVGMIGANPLGRRKVSEPKQRFYNIATAASITGFVRAFLMRAIAKTDRPLYCDTDCVAGVGIDVPVGSDLGEWSREGEFRRAAIAGRKLYAWKRAGALGPKQRRWKTASKGVRLTPAEIVRVAKGEKVLYSPEVPTFSIFRPVGFTPREVSLTV